MKNPNNKEPIKAAKSLKIGMLKSEFHENVRVKKRR
jgi:hypothetical protein